MVKNKRVKNKIRSNQNPPFTARRNAPSKSGRIKPGGIGFGTDLAGYYKLLADPCGGALVRAPYVGIGSGLVVRTRQMYAPELLGATDALTSMDFAYEVTPFNAPTAATYGGNYSGGGLTLQPLFDNCFVTNTSVVKGFRPIACCVKWVPNGPIASRRGTIGYGYSPCKTVNSGDTYNSRELLSGCAITAANGSAVHETKWLPSFEDERFGSVIETDINGAGSVLYVGVNVDCTSTGSGSSWVVVPNGYLEVTTVWEWEPATGKASRLVPATSPPSRSTLNEVLSRIGDIGRFVYGSVDTVAAAYQYAAGGVSRVPPGMRLT